ncbi:MAG: KilA-N domain-containing protein [Balneolaceae bacterium]
MAKNKKIEVQGTAITIYKGEKEDFISLTDIAKHKDSKHTDSIIQNWMRNRNTIELLGFWEQLHNPDFNPLEFEGIRDLKVVNFDRFKYLD